MFRKIASMFRTRPLFAQCIVGAGLFVSGDVISQTIFEDCKSLKEINPWRSFVFGIYGFFISVPLNALWYKMLDKFIRKSNVKTFRDTLSQVAFDQVLFAPLGIGVYFVCTNFLLGRSIEVIKDKLSNEYFSALKVNYITWPWIQLVNFHFVPLVYRTVVVNTAALGWGSYMSWLNHRRHEMDNTKDFK